MSMFHIFVNCLCPSFPLITFFVFHCLDISDISIKALKFNRSSKLLHCVSTGRPVDRWLWLINGMTIERNNSNYIQTQVITNYTTSTYRQSLSARVDIVLKGRITCIVEDSEGYSESKTVLLNSEFLS